MSLPQNARLILACSLCTGMVFLLSACNNLPNPFAPKTTEQTATPAPAASSEDLQTLFQSGVNYSQQGQWDQAIEQYQQVIAKDPNYASAHANLGWAYAETGKFDEAIEPLHKAITLEPNNAAAHANLAWAYAESKQWTLSVQEAEKATSLDTNNPYGFATLGWGLMETGQQDKAITAYEKAIALKSDLDTAHLALGNLYCQKKQQPKAEEHLQHLRQAGSPLASELSQAIGQGCK